MWLPLKYFNLKRIDYTPNYALPLDLEEKMGL